MISTLPRLWTAAYTTKMNERKLLFAIVGRPRTEIRTIDVEKSRLTSLRF